MPTKVNVKFLITGDTFDLDFVSNELGIIPTTSYRKGEFTNSRSIHSWKETCWLYSTGDRETFETASVLSEVIALFAPKIPEIKSIIQSNSLSVSICFIIKVEDGIFPAIILDPTQISFLQEVNATLEMDEYWFD